MPFDSVVNYLHTSPKLNAQVFWLDFVQKEIEFGLGVFMSLVMRIGRLFFWIALPIQAMDVDKGPKTVQAELDSQQRPIVVAQGRLDISGRALQSLQGIGAIPEAEAIRLINASNNELTNAGLEAIRLPAHVTTIDLSHNQLTEFPSEFIRRLPQTVTYVDLSHNAIDQVGQDFSVAQRGLRINLAHNRLRAVDLEVLQARITRPNFKFNVVQRCAQYFSHPFPILTKILGGLSMLAAYVLLKKRFVGDPQSRISRTIKIAQNGLYAVSGLHAIRTASKTNPEYAAGSLGLLIGTSPVMVFDTLSLKSGKAGIHATMPGKIESTYCHGVTAGMRAFGVIYMAGQCVSWLKDKITGICNAYLNRKRNRLIGDFQAPR